MATNTVSSTIVFQLLGDDNYENWSALMKNYLLAQDLWDIVQSTTEPPKPEDDVVGFKAWTKNNAAALYAILISCKVDILSEIREISFAKIVWDKLASMYGPSNSSSIPDDSSSSIPGALLHQYEPLREAINHGDWDAAIDFLSLNEDAKSARISKDGGTVLHAAVTAGCTKIVDKLVDLMSAEELEIKDEYGATALLWAAVQQNNIGMVDCMLRKNSNLLNIPELSDCVPLVMALQAGNLKVARHLYSVYLPHQTLRDIDASTALSLFILRKNFDLALHLLHRCQASAIVPNIYDSSALRALANNPSAFPSGNQLVFWKSWIYACIPIRLAHSSNEIQIEIDNPNQHRSDQVKISRSVLGLLRRLSLDLLKLLGIKQIYEMKLLHHQAHQLLLQMCSQVKQMNRDHVKDAVFVAVRSGIVEFIDEILKADETLVSVTDEMERDIMYHAVLHRQAKVYRLIYEIVNNNWITQVSISDKSGNNLLHMTAMLEPSTTRDRIAGNNLLHMTAMLEPSTTRDRIAGEALKMQSELQWFKVIS
ncbi:hypothetical protein FH972_011240 [Carpinus fangiana]|uniref:DUF4219 domain-containing protein n=1 Tax=Carpinus fangiana TaxID=176857 RepID=A0A660KSJ8_9ROSI|nr:hypothetical protein FH972_011240 [Carpinus fangiana]